MMHSYQIFADATADLTSELMVGLPYVEIIPMQVEISDIGPVIGAHSDPGTLALFYWESNR